MMASKSSGVDSKMQEGGPVTSMSMQNIHGRYNCYDETKKRQSKLIWY
jgi:hypothetical protein